MRSDSKPNDDRKRTEELLAGFDRTGRTPQPPRARRDFVDFHESGAEPTPRPPKQAAAPTFVIRRESAGVPSWILWAGVVLVMLIGGGAVAWLVTPTAPRTNSPPPPSGLVATSPTPPTSEAMPTATASATAAESVPESTPATTSTPSARPKPPASKAGGFVRSL